MGRQDHVCRFRSDRNSPACMQQTRGSARMQQTREISLVSPVPRENGGPAVFQRVGAPETLGAVTRNQIIIRCRFLIGLCEASFLLFMQPFSVLVIFSTPGNSSSGFGASHCLRHELLFGWVETYVIEGSASCWESRGVSAALICA